VIGPDPEEIRKRIEDSTPLRLAQAPEDHAGVYVLLASRRNARAMTGQIIMSDGGIAARSL
jgi:NAD(P)-dependent dehydrogenase (short-subunit alcohol dehydrogenase family)